jgi:LysR family glycine cleavage system transcriptional activator
VRDPLPSIGMLVAFDAVMAAGSFARAAGRLNLTPAAVSYQVKSLEKLLGSTLFERLADRVVPTALAHELAPESGKILKSTRRFRDRGAATARRAATVRVLAAQTLASLWLLPRIADLIASFPDRRFEIMSWLGGTRPQRLSAPDTELHIEMRWARKDELPPRERAALIAHDSAIPICTPEYRNLYRGLADASSRRRVTLICPLSWPDIWDRWSEHALGERLDAVQKIYFQNSALCIQAAASGVGIAIAHSPLIAAELDSGKLVRAHARALDLAESYYAVDKSGPDLGFFDEFVSWCRRNMRAPANGRDTIDRRTRGMTYDSRRRKRNIGPNASR